MLELGVKVLVSYLLGSLNGSLVLGKIFGVDIRTAGSGNPGGTNALRTQGKLFALLVMIIDVGKGFVVAWFLPMLVLPAIPLDPEVSRAWLTLACGGAAIVGHCYPVWFQFAGGKGMATAVGVLLAIAPELLLPGIAVFAAVLILSGYVGLATMSTMCFLPVYFAFANRADRLPTIAFLIMLAAFIVFTHRDNIQRMRLGQEHRHDKAMLFRR